MVEKFRRASPVITNEMAERLHQAAQHLPGDYKLRDLISIPENGETQEWIEFQAGIKNIPEGKELHTAINSVLRSMEANTIQELRDLPDETLEGVRNIGRGLRFDLLRTVFGKSDQTG